MSGQIEEGIRLRYCDRLWTTSNLYDLIARPNFSFLQDAKVKSWSFFFSSRRRHTRFIHANAHAVARHARLRYFKDGVTNPVSIADTHLLVREPLDGEVF